MPIGGPRSRPGQSNARPQPSATSRNEAFESIFGRPSVAHHMPGGPGGPSGSAPGPGPPPGGGYGYAAHPSTRSVPEHLHPNQPSYPPGQAYVPPPAPRPSNPYPQQHVYQPPPRGDSSMRHRDPYDGATSSDPYRGSGGSSSGHANNSVAFPQAVSRTRGQCGTELTDALANSESESLCSSFHLFDTIYRFILLP